MKATKRSIQARVRRQGKLGLEVVGGIVRHRKQLLRVALAFGRNDGWIAGRACVATLGPTEAGRSVAAILRDEEAEVRFNRNGYSWTIPSGDMILAEMLAFGRYESEEVVPLIMWARKHRPAGAALVVEAGANVGTTTLPLVAQGCSVLAFEPVPRIRSLLEENLRANGMSESVRVLGEAVTESPCTVRIRVAGAGGSELVTDEDSDAIAERRGAEYFSGRGEARGHQYLEVPGAPLSSRVGDLGIDPDEVLLVWSDTEGAETGVIRGGSLLWSTGVPLWVEFWPSGLEEHGGLDAFFDAAGQFFGAFVHRDDLMSDEHQPRQQPLSALRDIGRAALLSEASWWSTDVLLVPFAAV